MTLKEKYHESKQLDEEARKEQNTANEKKVFFEGHGIAEGKYALEQVQLSEDQKKLFKEATDLIHEWTTAKLSFTKDDVKKLHVSKACFAWLQDDKEPHYIKYKWKDGTIGCAEIMPAMAVAEGRRLSKKRRAARKAIRNLAEETTKKRTGLQKYIHEPQKYVLLKHYSDKDLNRTSGTTFILFKDALNSSRKE